MDEIRFRYITDDKDPALDQVRPLLAGMYREMRRQGLMLPLADDGADKWIDGIQSSLGRFGILAVVYSGNRLAGFAHGALKYLPDYLGGYRTGVITHVYVHEDLRGQKVGRRLVSLLEQWFGEKKVHSVELQVIAGNDARAFWEKAGYTLELLQYRKLTGNGH